MRWRKAKAVSIFSWARSSDPRISPKETIFQEGEHGDEFFVVVRGEVEIRSGNRHLETLGQDSIFGEMALIDDSPRSATAVALTD